MGAGRLNKFFIFAISAEASWAFFSFFLRSSEAMYAMKYFGLCQLQPLMFNMSLSMTIYSSQFGWRFLILHRRAGFHPLISAGILASCERASFPIA